jgi:hypothetical protein
MAGGEAQFSGSCVLNHPLHGEAMMPVAGRLRELVARAAPRLRLLTEPDVSEKPSPEKWSRKEILGHLIDSASNNHQRFVRMQLRPDIGAFVYDQVEWNRAQKYQMENWPDLVELWRLYNQHLAHVIERADPSSISNICDVGAPAPANLGFIMEDYVRHVRHHLDQILGEPVGGFRSKQ